VSPSCALQEELLSDAGLERCFQRAHVIEVTERDEFALSLWRRVKPQVHAALRTIGVEQVCARSQQIVRVGVLPT